MSVMVIRGCDWIVAWDADAQRHVYKRGGDVAFDGTTLMQVGGRYEGPATEISGAGKMVMPGLVDLHSHPSTEPYYRGVREEHGVAQQFMTGLYERSIAFRPDPEAQLAGAELAFCEMLLSGVTSLADLSAPYEGWLDLAGRSGLRGFVAPGFASARWKMGTRWELDFAWDEAEGERAFGRALALIDAAMVHNSGRLSGIVFPAQIETCTPDLLKAAMAEARARKLPITTHASQSVNEFLEIVKRSGVSPVQYAAQLGLLDPSMTLAHCIFIDDHSWLHWRTRRDLDLLVESRTSVAHCPMPFARYGAVLEDFGRYRRAGINIGIGTDTTPHNMLEELRLALILCKTTSGDVDGTSLGEVFHAATIGGATALLRDDIGRLAPGCKADLLLIDLEEPWMIPARDPLRSLVFHAADRAVCGVFIDGHEVVRDGRVLTLDRESALERVKAGQERMLKGTKARDFQGRDASEVAPLTLEMM